MKRALITGISGQDGSYLAELLLGKGYQVYGLLQADADARYVPSNAQRVIGDLTDFESLKKTVTDIVPDEVYNCAGITDLKTAYADPGATRKINYESVGVLLEESIQVNPQVRFLQLSSSEIFVPSPEPLHEGSPRDWQTQNPYAEAKMMADRDFIERFRNEGSYACSAILFNHESPRRPESSLLRKVTSTIARIARGQEECLYVGNVDAERDWGYAGDYVVAMHLMLQQKLPSDFVIASGVAHSVRDAITASASVHSMELYWEGGGEEVIARDQTGTVRVRVNKEFYRPTEMYPKRGDISKITRELHWEPQTDFKSLITMMSR